MSFRKSFSIAALALMALGMPTASKAAFITQTFTHVAQTVPYTFSFGANQFNPAQGTLTSVTISETSNITGQVTVYNFNATAQTFTNATASVPVMVTGPGGLSLSVTATTPGASGSVGAYMGGAPPSTTISGLTVMATASSTITDPNQFSSYVGTGTNNLNFTFMAGTGTYSGTANSGVAFTGSATADASITITYNYTPSAVPEPASFAMVAMGLSGLVVVRRVRRRTA